MLPNKRGQLMVVKGMVTATKNPKWLRIIPAEVSQFSNAMIEAGEFSPGDTVVVSISKEAPTDPRD